MMKALLRVRFRALVSAFFRRNGTKKGKGMAALMVVLFAYVAVVFCGMFAYLFNELAGSYHAAGLDWLYFAMAGLMALAFSIIGSVFITQSQLYDARDNDLLLSLPISPRQILLSRMVPLLALDFAFCAMVMGPAYVVYLMQVGCAPMGIAAMLLSLVAVPVLSLSLTCLLGWLLHQLLRRMNPSLASAIYLIVFLGLYFYVYSQAGKILNAMAAGGAAMAGALKLWAWPLYAMGQGCTGNAGLLLAFLGITAAVSALVYWFLSVTFLRSAVLQRKSRKGQKLDLGQLQAGSVSGALRRKELRRFLGSPVYLTNMGLGIVLIPVLAVLGILFRRDVLRFLNLIPGLFQQAPLLVAAAVGFLVTTVCVSTPSVSLEGKSIWILKSLPLTARQILLAKLRFHCLLAAPVSMVSGLALALTYGFAVADTVLCTLFPGVLGILCGVLGLVCGLKWARLDWTSEAGPCKQSAALLITMLGLMALLMVVAVVYAVGLYGILTPTFFLGAVTLILALASLGLYRLLVTWGCRAWEAL